MRRTWIAWLALLIVSVTRPAVAEPIRFPLDGAWQLHDASDERNAIAATVPGVVQTDLLAAGRIEDPFDQDNAKQQEWIDQRTWIYTRSFDVPAALLEREHVLLRFEGLDTIAAVELNGRNVAQTDNMFRTYEFDVKPLLRDGQNSLKVTFFPLEPYIEAFKTRAPKLSNATGPGLANVRKSPYQNGWDFCARARTCGMYKHVELLAYDAARLRGVRVESNVDSKDKASLRVAAVSDGSATSVRVSVRLGETRVAEKTVSAAEADAFDVPIENPQLWWPRSMGPQPLYDVMVELLAADGTVIDRATRRVGLRKIELQPKTDDRPMRLLINGKPFFAKGASWVPPDLFLPRVTPQRIRALVRDAADANMNMLRTWGGGAYEDDAFFDACDELGMLVWFDFKFACSVYPGGNPSFAENVRREIDDQVLRVGSHPSIAVWCGNNECLGAVTQLKMLSQDDYDTFFRGVVGDQLATLLPRATFVEGSPGVAGDEHNWWVWHIGADFEKYREAHGFMSEFGFQSFPHPATVNSYTRPADRASLTTPMMKEHQHNGNGKGNEQIANMLDRYFAPANDVESTIWLSQINQAYGMAMGIDHWRSDWPRSSGALVWQLDDCYPGPSWSLIDYYGRRKAAWYAVRRSFAPLSITTLVDERSRRASVKVVSDRAAPTSLSFEWTLTDCAGRAIDRGSTSTLAIEAGTRVIELPSIDLAAQWGDRVDRLLWCSIAEGDQVIASKLTPLARPKLMRWVDPQLAVTDVAADGGGFAVTVRANRPAAWAWLELANDPDARFDDNFVDLPAAATRTIHMTPSKPFAIDAVRRRLRLRSLYEIQTPAAPTTQR